MSDDNNVTPDNQDTPTDIADANQPDNQDNQSESDAETKVKQLMAELDKANQVLEKARKGEKYAKSQKDKAIELAKADIDAKYADEIAKLKNIVNGYESEKKQSILTKALSEAGAIDIKAVSKLIGDNPDTDMAIKQAMNDYPALFANQKPETPAAPNRSTDGLPTSNLEAELAAARKLPNYRIAVNQIYQKYGISF